MLERPLSVETVTATLNRSRVVALLGPRQSGKTTLARQFVPATSPNYFDLEDPLSLARLAEPMTALQGLSGTVVIDEVQRMPELFSVLRVLADRTPLPARFLILGSAAPGLLQQSSESLAGRMELVNLSGLSLTEVGVAEQSRHWLRGGFPLSFLAHNDEDSLSGGKILFRRCWSATFRNWALVSPPPPCNALGPCWPTFTGKCGTPPSWPVRWE